MNSGKLDNWFPEISGPLQIITLNEKRQAELPGELSRNATLIGVCRIVRPEHAKRKHFDRI
ncbi:Gp63 [Roseibium sp. TrichSKD4]|nr:Gp63 [Roseibium sp. TrichSKD4]